MKRSLIAAALAAFAAAAFATVEDPYRTNAGESEQGNVVQQQLGDASDAYRFNAGEQDGHQTQVG